MEWVNHWSGWRRHQVYLCSHFTLLILPFDKGVVNERIQDGHNRVLVLT